MPGNILDESSVLEWMINQKMDESIDEIDRDTLFEYIETKEFLAVVWCEYKIYFSVLLMYSFLSNSFYDPFLKEHYYVGKSLCFTMMINGSITIFFFLFFFFCLLKLEEVNKIFNRIESINNLKLTNW